MVGSAEMRALFFWATRLGVPPVGLTPHPLLLPRPGGGQGCIRWSFQHVGGDAVMRKAQVWNVECFQSLPIVSVSPGAAVKVPPHIPSRRGEKWGAPRAGRAEEVLDSRQNLENLPCSYWSCPCRTLWAPEAPLRVLPQEAPPPTGAAQAGPVRSARHVMVHPPASPRLHAVGLPRVPEDSESW